MTEAAAIPAFSAIRGHDRAVAMVRRAVQSERMHHAWLFQGPEGVGKTTLARAMAGLLLCDARTPEHEERCGACRSCRMLDDGNHPDLIEIEPDGRFIKIDQVRQVVAATRYRPVQSRLRVVRILHADALREEAANALLKTLEEPGGETVFQLVTSQAARLLTTIRSRCMPLRLGMLSAAIVEELLAEQGHTGAVAQAAARLSGGSLSRAVQRLERESFLQRAGLYAQLVDVLRGNDDDALQLAGQLSAHRDLIEENLELLRSLYRDAAVLAAGASPSAVADPEALPWARRLAEQGVAPVLGVVRRIEALDGELARNVNARLAFESLLLDCASAARTPSRS